MTEQEYAIMEAHRNVAEDALFDALPTSRLKRNQKGIQVSI